MFRWLQSKIKGKELIHVVHSRKSNNLLETIKILLESKADVNYMDKDGCTALFSLNDIADIPLSKCHTALALCNSSFFE